MEYLLGGGLGFILTLILLPVFMQLLTETGATRPNYRGETIPVGTGLLFVIVYFILSLFLFHWYSLRFTVFLLGMVFFCLLGLLDDLLGSGSSRGLKGHFRSLLRGKLTTGALKALGGGIVALLIAFMSFPRQPWWEILTAALLIALAANTINLLDLRPGRALKGFLLWFLVLAAAVRGEKTLVYLAPLVGSAIAFAPADLKTEAMMGDTGSNLLGAGLGMVTAWRLSFHVQVVVVIFLLLLHLFTEKYSLTEIIEGNRILRFLDHLGRNKP